MTESTSAVAVPPPVVLPEAQPAAPVPAPVDIDPQAVRTVSELATSALNHWFHLHIKDTAVSRDTEIFNQVAGAIGAIKTLLSQVKE